MVTVLPSTWKVYYVPLLQSQTIYKYKIIQNHCILQYEGYILLMNSKRVNICSIGKNTPYRRPTSPIHLYTLLWMTHGPSNWFILGTAFCGLLVLLKILYVWFLTLKTSWEMNIDVSLRKTWCHSEQEYYKMWTCKIVILQVTWLFETCTYMR